MAVRLQDQTKSKYILSREEGLAYFEEAIPSLLGISAAEFLRRYDAGEYANTPDDLEHRNLLHAEFLIPLARPDS